MRLALLTLLSICLGAGVALASGFHVADQGPRAAGRAGAFTARADDLSAIDVNPAGLARVRGTRFLLANRFTWAYEEYRRARTVDWSDATHGIPEFHDFDPVTNAADFQALGPMIGLATDFGLEDWGFAAGVYGPPGTTSQRFPADGPQKYMLIERDVAILYYTLAAAWKHDDDFGFGLSLQWVDVPFIRFRLVADGNTTPRIVSPAGGRFDVENEFEGSDRVGFTARLGAWYKPLPSLEIALSGRVVPVPVDADCQLSVDALNLTLDEPPAITRDGVPDDRVTFSMMLPITARAGVRYVHRRGERELFDLELDLGYEAWSMIDSFTMDGSGLVTEVLGQKVPIGKIQMPRNWKDTWSLHLGGDLSVIPDHLTLRGGFFYESPAVDPEYAYIDIYSSHRLGPAAGFTVALAGFELSAAYTYVFQMPVTVTEEDSKVYQQVPGSPCVAPYTDVNNCSEHYYGQPAAPANAGTYLSDYHMLNVGLSAAF